VTKERFTFEEAIAKCQNESAELWEIFKDQRDRRRYPAYEWKEIDAKLFNTREWREKVFWTGGKVAEEQCPQGQTFCKEEEAL